MRSAVILFLLCVSIGSASAWFGINWTWPPWSSSVFTDINRKLTNETCSYFSQHPDRASTALKKINETLYKTSETTQMFALTIAYINDPANQAKLVGGTDPCATFFSGLKDQLVADWKNQNFSVAGAQQKALAALQSFYNIIKSVIN